MIRFIQLVFIFLFFNIGFCFSYYINSPLFTQWFTNFAHYTSGFDFTCNWQCIIWLWYLKNSEQVSISGKLNWTGELILVYIIWKQVIPFKKINIKELDKPILLTQNSIYNQLPKNNTIIWLVLNWYLSWKKVRFDLANLSFRDKILLYWRNFIFVEGITPYIINLKYWFKLFNIQAEKFLTYLWFILLIFVVFWWKYRHMRILDIIIYVLVVLTSIISFKNLYEYYDDTKTNIINFDNWNNVFYVYDYYNFIKQLRSIIHFDHNCTYKFISFRSWPFERWANNVYLKPCKFVKTSPKYVILYHANIPEKYKSCTLIYQKASNLLLKCK